MKDSAATNGNKESISKVVFGQIWEPKHECDYLASFHIDLQNTKKRSYGAKACNCHWSRCLTQNSGSTRRRLNLRNYSPYFHEKKTEETFGNSQEDNKNTPVKEGQPVKQVAPQTALLIFLCENWRQIWSRLFFHWWWPSSIGGT